MIRDPHSYTLVRAVALRDAPAGPIRCTHGGELIVDPARVGSDPAILAALRRGDGVVDDTVYVVRGPDGEHYLCPKCAVRLGITRGAPADPPIAGARPRQAAAPPARAGAPLWRRRWSLLALFGGILVALAVFELYVEDVGDREGAPWDRPILRAVRALAAPAHGSLPRAIAALGDLGGTLPLCALAVLALALRRRWDAALYVGVAYGGALVANRAINGLFSALNGGGGDLGPGPAGGYLSSAATGSLALLAALAALAWPTRWRWPALALAAPLVALVGVVRVALGADDPSDVLGGWAGALAWSIGVYLTLSSPPMPSTTDAAD